MKVLFLWVMDAIPYKVPVSSMAVVSFCSFHAVSQRTLLIQTGCGGRLKYGVNLLQNGKGFFSSCYIYFSKINFPASCQVNANIGLFRCLYLGTQFVP